MNTISKNWITLCLIIILQFVFYSHQTAQNLVRNGSFENVTGSYVCDQSHALFPAAIGASHPSYNNIYSYMQRVDWWRMPKKKNGCISSVGSPDVVCDAWSGITYEKPMSGDKYGKTFTHEYLVGELSSPLVKGKVYQISLNYYAHNVELVNSGLMITNTVPKQCGDKLLDGNPGPYLNLAGGVASANGWKKVTGLITPPFSGLKYIVLGQFKVSKSGYINWDDINIEEYKEEPPGNDGNNGNAGNGNNNNSDCSKYQFDPCCPPMNPDLMAELFEHKPLGGINGNYRLKFKNNACLQYPMQAYIDYINQIEPNAQQLKLGWRMWEESPVGASTNVAPQNANYQFAAVAQHTSTFTANGNGIVGGTNFFNYSCKPNTWYKIHVGIWIHGGTKFFETSCSDGHVIYYRVLVGKKNRPQKMQISNGKRIITEQTIRNRRFR